MRAQQAEPTPIPVVDLAGTREDAASRLAAAGAIGRAARDTGFFYVVNHGIADGVTSRAFAEARRFYALPVERKLALQMVRGEPLGYEPLEFQQLEAARPSDRKESFGISGDRTIGHWPDLPGFSDGVLAYHAAACDLGAHLMSLIATSLDLAPDAFVEAYRGTDPTMRLLRYPADRDDLPSGQIGAGAHTDWGGITVLAQDDAGGLEIRDPMGVWRTATPIPGAFVINLGDLMVRWTNGRYRSSLHRVHNVARDRDRYSIAIFYSPNVQARIACLPTCVSDAEPARFAPCTAGEHVAQRRRETYGIA
jgi:isopenicillin N synthase-like dioxygenase